MIFLTVFGVSIVATCLVRFIPIMDVPTTSRQLHTQTIARTGGIAIVSTVGLGLGLGVFLGQLALTPKGYALVGASFGGFLVGLTDDTTRMSVITKAFGIFLVSVVASVIIPIRTIYLPFLGDLNLPLVLGGIGVAIWIFTFTNLANFMDGANGLAFGVMAIVFSCQAILAGALWQSEIDKILWIFTASMAGYFVWNILGKIFAGDSGALSCGAALACSSVIIAQTFGIWSVATMVLPILVDGLLTIFARARNGKNITQAHSDHIYQRLIKAGWRHWQTSFLYMFLTLACCIIAFFGAVLGDVYSFSLFTVSLLAMSGLWGIARSVTNKN